MKNSNHDIVTMDRAISDYFRENSMNLISDAVRDFQYGANRRRVTRKTVQRILKRNKLLPFCLLALRYLMPKQKKLEFQ